MSRLRLAAGCAVLRLAQEPCYHEIITLEQYQLCALVINVSLEYRRSVLHYRAGALKSPLIPGLICFNDEKRCRASSVSKSPAESFCQSCC